MRGFCSTVNLCAKLNQEASPFGRLRKRERFTNKNFIKQVKGTAEISSNLIHSGKYQLKNNEPKNKHKFLIIQTWYQRMESQQNCSYPGSYDISDRMKEDELIWYFVHLLIAGDQGQKKDLVISSKMYDHLQ